MGEEAGDGDKRNGGEPLKVEDAFARNCFIVMAEVLGRLVRSALYYFIFRGSAEITEIMRTFPK